MPACIHPYLNYTTLPASQRIIGRLTKEEPTHQQYRKHQDRQVSPRSTPFPHSAPHLACRNETTDYWKNKIKSDETGHRKVITSTDLKPHFRMYHPKDMARHAWFSAASLMKVVKYQIMFTLLVSKIRNINTGNSLSEQESIFSWSCQGR